RSKGGFWPQVGRGLGSCRRTHAIILALPTILIRRFSGNFFILTEIKFVNKATTCLGGALTLRSRRTLCSQQSRILATAGQCWVASGHRFPLESDVADGHRTAFHSPLLAQCVFHAGLRQTVGEIAHGLVVFKVSLGNPPLDLLAFDDESALNLRIWLDGEVGETTSILLPHCL